MSRPHLVSLFDQVQNLIIIINKLFFEASNLDCVWFILTQLELIMIVKKIVELAAVYLIHRHRHRKISLVILPVIDAAFEKILNGDWLDAVHRKSLTGASLTVSKNCYDTLVED